MANEKRLIDAKEHHMRVSKKLMTDLFPDWKEFPEDVQEKLCKFGKEHERLLFEAPTVDAVEVVRCKDCKWFNKAGYDNSCEDDMNLHMGFCLVWRRGTQTCRFCSYGERKDND